MVAIADGFGIPKDSAFALGLLVHVMILATTSIGGVTAMVAFRRRRAAAVATAGTSAETAADGVPPGVEGGEPAP